ncbi:hypothetical protein QYE76_046690 [Lolium multiflorum]|uniref:DDE Tnp4 domain-containing protein n=1 Tax=Lolium multiflorum TaxID=4521 RepID=A0AAD8TQ97_LOLMU|nr:hypothetical protein QYE76_046690 [Lolium multiflorum]
MTEELWEICLRLWEEVETVERDVSMPDLILWKGSASGEYSAKSTYQMLCQGNVRWGILCKPDCIGAIDGTHVTAKVPRSMSVAFRGRKHYTSQNVLATVDFNMRFTYVLVGWEGSAHDASILADSLSRPDGLQIPDGKFYLGDDGYACRPGILPLFRKTRYHLNEFSAKYRSLNARELFNLRHSRLRVTIERAFAALKNRFKVLDQKPFHTFDTQVTLVLACCILHNWILCWCEDEFFEEVVTFDEVETGHGVEAGDNDAWKVKRRE